MYKCPLPYITWERGRWRLFVLTEHLLDRRFWVQTQLRMRLTLRPTLRESLSQEYLIHILEYISFARYSTDGYMTS